MITAKNFIEFMENELNIKCVDVETGKRLLDIIEEQERNKKSIYSNPEYKSDYDKYMEEQGTQLIDERK